MAGSFKSGGRGRPYGFLLILAVGAAVFAVMVLHKMRERRIFNILITEKDHNLLTLQLLLQKERDSTVEMKRKVEELKTKTHSLRSQKMELSKKIMEMKSMTASLKEEQRTLESALDEKQNEIRVLRQKETDHSKESSKITTLTDLLKQKEAEIEEMKHQLESPINNIKEDSKITTLTVLLKQKEAEIEEMKHQLKSPINNMWSAITDDPSKLPANLTATEVSGNAENGTGKDDNANSGKSTIDEGSSTSAIEGTKQKEILREAQLQKQENSHVGEDLKERGEGGNKNAEDSQDQEEISGDTKMKETVDTQDDRDTTEFTGSRDDGFLKNKDEGGGDTGENYGRNQRVSINMQQEKSETLQDTNSQLLRLSSKGGMNLEEPARVQKVVGSRLKDQYSRRSITRGKRRRTISRGKTMEIINEGKPEEKLWRSIHGRRQFEKNSSPQGEADNSAENKHSELSMGAIEQPQDQEIKRASDNLRNDHESEENSNPNKSEMDFSYNSEDQTMDADDVESANAN